MYYISYSLFGNDLRYLDGLFMALHQNRELYPNWLNIVYCDRSIPDDWKVKLKNSPAVIEWRDLINQWDGLYWRFEVFDREDCELALIRDADSPSTKREADFVDAWIQSGKVLHIIRDHPSHGWAINAGMWGFRGSIPFSMKRAIHAWEWKDAKSGDQHFLRRKVYNKYYSDSLVHTSSVAFTGEDFIKVDAVEDFVGRPYFDSLGNFSGQRQIEVRNRRCCWEEVCLVYEFMRRRLKRKLGL